MKVKETNKKVAEDRLGDFIGRLVIEVAQAPAFSRTVKSMLSTILKHWSKDKYWRKKISSRAEKVLSRVLSQPEQVKESELLKDPSTIKLAADLAPSLVNGIFLLLVKINEASRTLPPEVRAEYLASVLNGIDAKQVGRFLTAQVTSINELAKTKPGLLTNTLEAPVNDLIESIDFGELKEVVDGLEHSLGPLLKMVSEAVWKYPAKFVCLMGCLPPLVNGGAKAIHEILRPLNNLAPELLADVIFSVLRMLNGKEIGLLANSVMELVRKLHTGSFLLGKAGLPQFYTDLKPLLQDIVSTIDPTLLSKLKVALAEDAETITKSYTEVISQNQDVYTAIVSSYASQKNPKIRASRLKLTLYESFPEEDVAEAVSTGMADLDTQEIGEMINAVVRYINLIHGHKPEMIPRILSEIVLAVDTDKLKSAADKVIGDIVDAVKPAVRAVMPSLLNGLAQLLTPDPDEESDDLNNAISSLRKVLVQEGV